MKEILRKIFFLPTGWVIADAAIAAVLLTAHFGFGLFEPMEIVIYTFSAYALTVVIISLRTVLRRVIMLLRRIPIIDRIFADGAFRTGIFFAAGSIANAFYILFYAYMSVIHDSLWFGALALYELVLLILKIPLVTRHAARIFKGHISEEAAEWRLYHIYGYLMLLLNFVMGIITTRAVMLNETYGYGFYMIFMIAFYAFFRVISATISFFKSRRRDTPTILAMRVISLATALETMYALQTALIDRFGTDAGDFRLRMNAISGAAIFIIMMVISTGMIIRSTKKNPI